MRFDAALDVSVSKCAVWVVSSEDGAVVLETTVPTEPEAIAAALAPYASRLRRLGHEAGALSPWLHRELQVLGLPAVLLETRHAAGLLKAQRNKMVCPGGRRERRRTRRGPRGTEGLI